MQITYFYVLSELVEVLHVFILVVFQVDEYCLNLINVCFDLLLVFVFTIFLLFKLLGYLYALLYSIELMSFRKTHGAAFQQSFEFFFFLELFQLSNCLDVVNYGETSCELYRAKQVSGGVCFFVDPIIFNVLWLLWIHACE